MAAVAVLGLGSMGAALAAALLRAGHQVTVWNRTPGKADALVAAGAHHADSPAPALRDAAIVLVCLLDDGAVTSTLKAAGDVLAGRIVVNLTNNTPAEARALGQWVAWQGAQYLDGGIMAIPPMIGGADAMILYSGDRSAFAHAAPVLGCLGSAEYLGSDAGLAALHDLALLSAMYGMFAGYLHAAALVGSEKVPAQALNRLAIPWLQGMIEALPPLAVQIDSGDYARDVVSNLSMQMRAMDSIMAASRAQGVNPHLLASLQAMMHKRVAAGHGDEDLGGLVEQLKLPRAAA